MQSKHLVVSGRVQGVNYRAWFCELARTMSIKGWVRNRANGTVEAVIQGGDDDLNAMVKAAHSGPALADVSDVQAKDVDYEPAESFEVKATE